jgi:putative DNA methylase
MTYKKKLIEVALPLEAINVASAREKSIRHGHPSTLHLWWARRPLAAARAVIFAQMVDDPSAHPDIFPTEKKQEKERQRLFRIIEELVKWENTTNETVLQQARDEIWQSWRYTCAENADDPRAKELFDRYKLPSFHDPFAGGGALPLEAQRLGLESYASDLNPVAVLINKAMIEIPPKFAGKPPVNPETHKNRDLAGRDWKGAQGLAEDVRYYGQWMRDEAEKRIGHLYPKIEVTAAMVQERPDLKQYAGRKLTVIAWLWARTVKSPNPAFADVDVPLASTFMLSTKAGKEAYVEPVIEDGGYRFTVKVGKPKDAAAAKNGTKVGRGGHFQCLMSRAPIPVDYIRESGLTGTMGSRLMAIVAEGDRGRVYLSPTPKQESIAVSANPQWAPDVDINHNPRDIRTQLYGLTKYRDLFTLRQLVALTTFSDLVQKAREQVKRDAIAAGLQDDDAPLAKGGGGAAAYADAVGVYLGFALSKQADLGNSLCRWEPVAQCPRQLFGRQAIPMIWDFAEGNPLGDSSGAWVVFVEGIAKAFAKSFERHYGATTPSA